MNQESEKTELTEKQIEKSTVTIKRNGGKRPGAGRRKGSQNKATVEQKIAENEMKQKILRALEPIMNAQLLIAQGETYVYKIVEEKDSKGKVLSKYHKLVEDPYEIQTALDELEAGTNGRDGDFYYVTTKRPDNKAIDSLIDRVFGKSRQNIGLDGGSDQKPIQIEISEIIAKKNGLN